MIFIAGPGHGGPAVAANTWLEGSYSELYPEVTPGRRGHARLFRQFSFPGGIPSHAAPETPGSIHEGGELGYALFPRLWRGVRQPGADRLLRRR
jgi:xylulose-5-phosphate/fructose-6-phosphate phosphoketolase